MGGLGGGHYTAYVRNTNDKKWYLMDDSRVSEVDEGRVVSPSAYVLFYMKRKTAKKKLKRPSSVKRKTSALPNVHI